MSETRRCPVAPDGRDLPWHVHDDWYEAAMAERDALREELERARPHGVDGAEWHRRLLNVSQDLRDVTAERDALREELTNQNALALDWQAKADALREENDKLRVLLDDRALDAATQAGRADALRVELERVTRTKMTAQQDVEHGLVRDLLVALGQPGGPLPDSPAFVWDRSLQAVHNLRAENERLREALVYIAGFVGLDPEHRVRVVARAALTQPTPITNEPTDAQYQRNSDLAQGIGDLYDDTPIDGEDG